MTPACRQYRPVDTDGTERSRMLALFFPGGFPGLELEFWAVKAWP